MLVAFTSVVGLNCTTRERPPSRPRASARAYKALYDECRADLSAMHFRYECRMADLHRELEQTRAAFEELKSIVRARQHAEQELAALHRERDIARAEAAERDPNAALN